MVQLHSSVDHHRAAGLELPNRGHDRRNQYMVSSNRIMSSLVSCLVEQHNRKARLKGLHVGIGRLSYHFTDVEGVSRAREDCIMYPVVCESIGARGTGSHTGIMQRSQDTCRICMSYQVCRSGRLRGQTLMNLSNYSVIAKEKPMECRRLGRTEHLSSVVIFGAAAVGMVDEAMAAAALDRAHAAGVNHIDVAPTYGAAELHIEPWLARHRSEMFLGCKTRERTKDGAAKELRRSLERLRTDHVDLYQLHAVTDPETLGQTLAPGGALEAILEAREEGLLRHIGITGHGHQAPAVFAEALQRFPFDTVMFPLNPVLYANPTYRRDAQALLALCREKDVGVLIIKSAARQPWEGASVRQRVMRMPAPEERKRLPYTTWYEPHERQEAIDQAVWFVLSQPGVTAVASSGDVRILDRILDCASRLRPLSTVEQEAVVAAADHTRTVFV
jgi:aryl-alcohol dehydrogenase-like predicted oxidoreductase